MLLKGHPGKLIWGVAIVIWATMCVAQSLWAQPAAPINIAAIFSLTGHGAFANRSSVLGTRLAVEEINRRGGVLGRRLNLIFLDNLSTPIGSSLAANQAVVTTA